MHSVAIVDDSPDVRALWRAELEASGRFVVCAEGIDGAAAAEIATTCRPDVMLLDLSMPGLGGMEVLPYVVQSSPHTRVVVLSAMGRKQFARAALEEGAVAFLEKSLPAGSLAARLDEVLEAGAATPTQNRPVLVVEPSPDDRALLQYLLGWLGCPVLHANTGAEALQLLDESDVAVVLAAGALPDTSAHRLAAAVRRNGGHVGRTPVVAMGSDPATDDDPLAAINVLAKPVEAEALHRLLRRHGAIAAPPGTEQLVDDTSLADLRDRIGPEILRDVLMEFSRSNRERCDQIEDAFDIRDTDTIARTAHQIVGSARSLAAPALARAAHDLERLATSEATAGLGAQVERVLLLADDTERALLGGLPSQRDPSPSRSHRPGIVRRWRIPR